MDLWIRSQDRETLAKPVDISMIPLCDYNDKPNGEYGITSFTEMAGDVDLGTYATKERALEVLDEIQNIINAKTIIKFQCFVPEERIKQVKEAIDKYSIIELPDYEIKQLAGVIIYEMPKE